MPDQSTKSKPASQARQKPPVIATEQVICTCGHTATFEHFALKQDKFRDKRRDKLVSKPCPDCRIEAEKARIESAKAEKAVKGPKYPAESRLPDGSVFHLIYAAATKTWSGELNIGGTIFRGHKGGVFKLLRHLDQCYRDALNALAASEL